MSDQASSREGCGADAAAYAMGALEPAEAAAFRRHLETCAVCQDEVASFSEVVEVLPLAAPQHRAPGRLRRRVLREISSPPAVPGQARRRSRLARPALAGACAAALVAGALVGGIELGGTSGAGPAHVYAASVGDAVVKVSGSRAELIVHHLPQPGAGRIYEVWLKRDGQPPQPTRALFDVDTSGRGDVVVPASVRGVSALLVTAEPAGGTRAPTSAPVIVASL